MVASVAEEKVATAGSATTVSVTLTSTPSPGDVIVVGLGHNGNLGTTTITGCGASWTPQEIHESDFSTGFHQNTYIGRGATAAGTITITTTLARPLVARALRVTGATGTGVTSSYTANVTSGAVDPPSQTQLANLNQFVVALTCGGAGSSVNTTLFNTVTPSSGWTIGTANSTTFNDRAASIQPTSDGQSLSFTDHYTATGSRNWTFTFVMVGPDAAGFAGWGIPL